MLVTVIMAGGRGERFWPLSRGARPKQLLPLDGGRSLIQQTVDRLLPLVDPSRILVVTGEQYATSIARQLPWLPRENILVEPVGRNTAACIGLAALHLEQRAAQGDAPWGSDPVMLVLPADHVVRDGEAFRRVMRAAYEAARGPEGHLVTIGLWPTRPETGYGYIELGDPVRTVQGYEVYQVRRFVEKPDTSTARRYVAGGRHLWNSGMFLWRTEVIREAIVRHLPALHQGLEAIARAWAQDSATAARVQREVFEQLDSVSIDYGVMERAEAQTVVVPADFGWDDAGSWPSLERLFEPDGDGNVTRGGLHAGVDTGQCIVWVEGSTPDGKPRLVATLGVKDLVIVQTEDATLVCSKDRAQELKLLLTRLRSLGYEGYL